MKIGDKIIGITFIFVIFFLFVVFFIKPVKKVFTLSKKQVSEVNILQKYPFPENHNYVQPKEKSFFEKVNDKILDLEEKFKAYTTEKFYIKNAALTTSKYVDKLIGLDMTVSLSSGENDPDLDTDVVVDFEDDSLAFVVDSSDISRRLQKLLTFAKQMLGEGKDFLFLLPPGKFAGNVAYQDFSLERTNQIIKTLKDNNVPVLNVWDKMEESDVDISSLFFKTDHHWLPMTGIWADSILAEYLNNHYDYHIDTSLFDLNNYDIEILKNNYLGSQGKKVSTIYTKVDDFPIVTPKYDTDLEVVIASTNKKLIGNMTKTLFDYTLLKNKDLYTRYSYGLYGHYSQGLVQIHNKNVQDGKKILMIKESMADVMYPFLAAGVENLDVIDLRYFKGSLQAYLKENNPDMIIMVYGVIAFSNSGDKNGAFDFR